MTQMGIGWALVGAFVSMGTGGAVLAGCESGDDTASPLSGGGADGAVPSNATHQDAGSTHQDAGSAQQDGVSASSSSAPLDSSLPADSAGPQAASEADGDGAPVEAGTDAATDAVAESAATSRFITGVVQFNPTGCTGFGASSLPGIVEGPPVGGGSEKGSLDVVSLGSGGSIVVTFAPNAIVDGPGPDFIVFENPFWVGGNSNNVYAEPGEVSVSDDGTTWVPFPCTPTFDASAPYGTGTAPPYGSCAGWGVVYSTPENGISPFDPGAAGGNAYDLAAIGVTHARFVKIVDHTDEACPEGGAGPITNGFDLDAIAIVNAELP